MNLFEIVQDAYYDIKFRAQDVLDTVKYRLLDIVDRVKGEDVTYKGIVEEVVEAPKTKKKRKTKKKK